MLQDSVARRRGQWWLGLSLPLLPASFASRRLSQVQAVHVKSESSPHLVDCTEVHILLYPLIPETLRPWNFTPSQRGLLEAAHPFPLRLVGFVCQQTGVPTPVSSERSARHPQFQRADRSIVTIYNSHVEATHCRSMDLEGVVFRSYSYQGRKL